MKLKKPEESGIDAFQVLKDYKGQPRLLYPTKLYNTVERERKTFQDINRLKDDINILKEFISTKQVLHRILESILEIKRKTNTAKIL